MPLIKCPSCGEENPDKFRLCGYCGAQLAPEAAPTETRKTVTVVFSDLVGSTSLGERIDSESLREVLTVYFEEMRGAIEHHGGLVEKYIGDAVMAVFGLPRVREDDALRAVRAAFEMRARLETLNSRLEREWGVELRQRTGVNTGTVVAGDPAGGQRLVTGDTVNVAARLEQASPPMGILLGEATYRLVRDLVEIASTQLLELKGKAEPVAGHELRAIHEAEAIPRRFSAPLVGRNAELVALRATLGLAEAERHCHLVTVVAPAGTGKSRLLQEFQEGSGAVVVRGRCLSYGDNLTFGPLSEMVRQAAGITDSDDAEEARGKLAARLPDAPDVAERIGAVLGLGARAFPLEETFWAAGKFVESLATGGPAIWIVDDIHWAEGVFLKLLRHLVDGAQAPVVLACSARPDLMEENPDWGEGERQHALVLTPLTEADSLLVVGNLVGDDAFDPRAKGMIATAAAGNPLYAEQMVSMLVDEGSLRPSEGGGLEVAGDLSRIEVPPTISALLSARLDRLPPGPRQVLDRAAVVGLNFSEEMVAALCPETLRPATGGLLTDLAHRGFLSPAAEPGSFQFVHGLIRDTAYSGLLKRTRAELHQAHGDWLEGDSAAPEQEEIRGYHLEQAFLIRAELGRVDEGLERLGRRASAYLAAAGDRALSVGDMEAAGGLLRRAAALLPETEFDRPGLLVKAGEALSEVGDIEGADLALEEASRWASELGRDDIRAAVRVALLNLHFLTEGAAAGDATVSEAETALATLSRYGDHAGMARAYRLLLNIHLAACRYVAAGEAARRVIEETRLAGDLLMEEWVAPAVAGCAQLGPTPVEEAISICRGVLAQNHGNRRSRAVVLWSLSHLEAMRGDFEEARRLYAESREALESLGIRMMAALTSTVASGPVELLAGDWARAERELRGDYQAMERMGERNFISTAAALLAEAVYRQGRAEEALALTDFSHQVAAPDDVATQFLWRCVAAKVHADAGRLEEARGLVQEGVGTIAGAEMPDWLGMALLDQAYVLGRAGDQGGASAAIRRALDQFRAKGDTVSARRAEEMLAAAAR